MTITEQAAPRLCREFAIRADDTADSTGREFSGVAVPWETEIELWHGEFEKIARGAVQPSSEQVFVFWRHGEVVGQLTSWTDGPDGWEVTGRLSDTALGRDAAALLRDGVITKLSIGFRPVAWDIHEDESGTHVTYTSIDVREVSLVPIPAYDTATITSVRHRPPHPDPETEDTDMPEALTRADLTPITEQLEDLERSIAGLDTRGHHAPAGHQWRSMGEFLKAVAGGDQAAAEFHRAYTGATTADTVAKDTFVGEFIDLALARRRHVGIVSTGVLPAEGMSVDYVELEEDTTQVTEQAAEGDDLALGKVALKPANAAVKTYGGATQLSRQLIERASVATLDITLEALGRKYAAATDGAVRTAIADLITARVTLAGTEPDAAVELGADTSDGWLNAIVDAAMAWKDHGYSASRLLVAPATFKSLMNMKDNGQRVMSVYGENRNMVGSIDAGGLSGSLANVAVIPSAAVPAGAVGAFLDPAAVRFLESPGAPAKLQDSNVINLTGDYSLYGYAATLTPVPAACLPITPAV